MNGGNQLKGDNEFTTAEIVKLIQTFQQNRKDYWESGKNTDYTQNEGLFMMPMVQSFELAGYGYLYDIEYTDMQISIANNGTNRDGEILLNCSDMFTKYREVEDYIKTQLGTNKLYLTSYDISETTENATIFNVRISHGKWSETPIIGMPLDFDFPVISINTQPVWSYYLPASYIQVANSANKAFNPYTINYLYCRTRGSIIVVYHQDIIEAYPYSTPSYFLCHSQYSGAVFHEEHFIGFKSSYYLWINTKRNDQLQLPGQYRASAIIIDHLTRYYTDVNFNYINKITVQFGAWGMTPKLFNDNGPIIIGG